MSVRDRVPGGDDAGDHEQGPEDAQGRTRARPCDHDAEPDAREAHPELDGRRERVHAGDPTGRSRHTAG